MRLLYLFVLIFGLAAVGCEAQREAPPAAPEVEEEVEEPRVVEPEEGVEVEEEAEAPVAEP